MALRSLGAGHPIRLSVGISLGILLKVAVDTFAKILPYASTLQELSQYNLVWFIFAVAPAMFIPRMFESSIPDNVALQIHTIQLLLDKAKLSKQQEAIFWRALLNKYVEAASIREVDTKEVVAELESISEPRNPP